MYKSDSRVVCPLPRSSQPRAQTRSAARFPSLPPQRVSVSLDDGASWSRHDVHHPVELVRYHAFVTGIFPASGPARGGFVVLVQGHHLTAVSDLTAAAAADAAAAARVAAAASADSDADAVVEASGQNAQVGRKQGRTTLFEAPNSTAAAAGVRCMIGAYESPAITLTWGLVRCAAPAAYAHAPGAVGGGVRVPVRVSLQPGAGWLQLAGPDQAEYGAGAAGAESGLGGGEGGEGDGAACVGATPGTLGAQRTDYGAACEEREPLYLTYYAEPTMNFRHFPDGGPVAGGTAVTISGVHPAGVEFRAPFPVVEQLHLVKCRFGDFPNHVESGAFRASEDEVSSHGLPLTSPLISL